MKASTNFEREAALSSHSDTPHWLLWEELVPGGAHWSGLIRRGTTLRLMDVDGGANLSLLLFHAELPLERYNMADTLKAQHTAFLTKSCACYSDMGRILCSITEDTCGWHDTISGVINDEQVAKKYGATRFQEERNNRFPSGYAGFVNELGKYGLDERDLHANINFFSKVIVDDAGKLQFVSGHSKPGSYVDLRFEMNTIVIASTAPHPLDPEPKYRPREVRLTAWHSRPAAKTDVCRNRCPENERGFRNTEMLDGYNAGWRRG